MSYSGSRPAGATSSRPWYSNRPVPTALPPPDPVVVISPQASYRRALVTLVSSAESAAATEPWPHKPMIWSCPSLSRRSAHGLAVSLHPRLEVGARAGSQFDEFVFLAPPGRGLDKGRHELVAAADCARRHDVVPTVGIRYDDHVAPVAHMVRGERHAAVANLVRTGRSHGAVPADRRDGLGIERQQNLAGLIDPLP